MTYLEKYEIVFKYDQELKSSGMREKEGGDRRSANYKKSERIGTVIKTRDIAKKFNMRDERRVQECLSIVQNIPKKLRDLIRGTSISDNKTALKRISDWKIDKEIQIGYVKYLINRVNDGKPILETEEELVHDILSYLKIEGYDNIKTEVKTELGFIIDIVATSNKGNLVVIEAKNDCRPSDISKALGQLLCYKYSIPEANIYICTPTNPGETFMKILNSYDIKFLDIYVR